MIRLGIAEDQAIVRESLAIVLQLEPDMTVRWTAADGLKAVQQAQNAAVDVVLMDLRLPVKDGVSAAREIKQGSPETRVIVLTTFHQDEWLLDAMRAGATACLLKDVPPQLLAAAIRHIFADDWDPEQWTPDWRLYAPEVQFLRKLGQMPDRTADGLSARDIDILRLICQGALNQEIALRLHLTEGTVKNYVSALYAKLGVRHRAEAVQAAKKRGLGDMGKRPLLPTCGNTGSLRWAYCTWSRRKKRGGAHVSQEESACRIKTSRRRNRRSKPFSRSSRLHSNCNNRNRRTPSRRNNGRPRPAARLEPRR